MNKYYDLEISILSCLLQKPKLMEKVILCDNHFIKHKKMWLFMKSFYKKFQNFDLALMYSVCKNKYHLMSYIEMLLDAEPSPSLFDTYQQQLIDLYNQTKKEKYLKEKIYSLANDLYIGNLNLEEFETILIETYDNANKLYNKEG